MPESQDTESILYKRQFLDRLNGGSAWRYTCMKYELCAIIRLYYRCQGQKVFHPHELAHKWMKDLGIRPNMSLKVG